MNDETILKLLLLAEDLTWTQQMNAMLADFAPPQCKVQSAQSITEGLQTLKAWPFDLILLDLSISNLSGHEALDQVQQASPNVPVIVLDDADDDTRCQEAARMGAWDYFCKTGIDAADLWAAIQVTLEGHQRLQALSRSEKKFRTIVETLEDAYYETDLEGRITYINDTFCNHLQRSREEIIGRRHADLSTPEADDRLQQFLRKIVVTGVSEEIVDDELCCADGTVMNAELTVSLMSDSEGRPIGYNFISRDVTDKKNAEKALILSEQKYRNILASIEDGYFEVDLKGHLTFCNEAQARMQGYTQKEMVGRHYSEIMDERNARKVFRAYNKIFKSGKPNSALQYEVTHKDGSKRHIESSVSLIKDEKDQLIGFRGIARDISERKQAERELAKAKAQAEEATLAKSDFLANMSHEIRTPLNGIIGMYNLLLTSELTTEQADFVETGKRSAEGLLAVINDILDFSKIEAGQLDIEIVDFDLRQSIREISALPAMQAQAKGLEFVYRIDPQVPTYLMGDPGRLRQIIMNLCTNAIKFTTKGEVVLSVSVEEDNSDRAKLRFSVRDTGIGISRSDQARLFQSFQQVDVSTTRKFGGTGLGLAISKKLTEMMGGEMGVESELHMGATFWFTADFGKQPGVVERLFEVPRTLQDKRILIVDDNQTNLDILAGYLSFWGCDCDRANSGAMALTLLKAVAKTGSPYDIVISDMLMPEMDGSELGRRIKADDSLKDTILVMLTSQGLRGDATEMKRIGFAAYLTKPVGRSRLFDCLIMILNTPQGDLPEKETHSAPESQAPVTVAADLIGSRILLAEDNMINQKLAMHLLTKFGLEADAVINGRQAVEALTRKTYDLVLMDIQMPEMDGLEAARIIRDPDSPVLNHHVPIIALTAHAMKGDREKCLSAGMNDYVAKPIQPDLLLKALERVLPAKAQPGAAGALPKTSTTRQ